MFVSRFHFAAGLMLWLTKFTLVNAATSSAFSLYVYGLNITGLPIFYMNSLAYIGNSVPENATDATKITWSMNETSLYIAKNTTAGGSANFTSTPIFHLNTTTETPTQAAFVTSNSSTTGSTTGFIFYGSSLGWKDTDGTVEEVFWATETDTENVYKLMWNQAGTLLSGGTPVVVKNIAPPTED